MTLTDTGPLVALIDRDDVHHARCTAQLASLSPPMSTPWPCFTEAMHLLGRVDGHRAQDDLWAYVTLGVLVLRESSPAEQARMRVLMAAYADTPMDLADAALVAAAEAEGIGRVFTVDRDFYVYRLADGSALEAVPGPRPKTSARPGRQR